MSGLEVLSAMTIPSSFTADKNSIDEFMLQEYRSIASAHFDSQAGLRQQFRFYLIIAAVPVTVLGLAFKDRPSTELEQMHVLHLPHILGSIFFAIGILGLLMLLSMIHTALDATLYARTVNGLRNYFCDRGDAIGIKVQPYLKMPTEMTRPRYFHVRAFFWMVVLIALINGAYIVAGIDSLYEGAKGWCSTLLVAGILIVQLGAYGLFCRQRGNDEVSK